ncbi:hypothetical protein AVEN_170596-1, partial [Araneus ventricosus]
SPRWPGGRGWASGPDWYQIRNLSPSKNSHICRPSVIWSTKESMGKRPIIDVVLKFGEEGIAQVSSSPSDRVSDEYRCDPHVVSK